MQSPRIVPRALSFGVQNRSNPTNFSGRFAENSERFQRSAKNRWKSYPTRSQAGG
jgi:hypothetical protein